MAISDDRYAAILQPTDVKDGDVCIIEVRDGHAVAVAASTDDAIYWLLLECETDLNGANLPTILYRTASGLGTIFAIGDFGIEVLGQDEISFPRPYRTGSHGDLLVDSSGEAHVYINDGSSRAEMVSVRSGAIRPASSPRFFYRRWRLVRRLPGDRMQILFLKG